MVRYVDAIRSTGRCPVAAICPDGELARWLNDRTVEVTAIPELGLPGGSRVAALARMSARWRRAAAAIDRNTSDDDILVVNGLSALPAVRLAGRQHRAVWLVHDVVQRFDRRVIGRLAGRRLLGRKAISVAGDLIAMAAQCVRQILTNRDIIFYNKNSFCHQTRVAQAP